MMRKANEKDLARIVALLEEHSLPFDDCAEHLQHFIVHEKVGGIVAVGGAEYYDGVGLIRSIVVSKSEQGKGIACLLINELLNAMKEADITQVYLLTTTASHYFEKKNFTIIERRDVPRSIQKTQQFSSLCPSSATVMRREV
ncbi:arsenic resistance N-acetyltransferase ArsN2 [Eionea flava]